MYNRRMPSMYNNINGNRLVGGGFLGPFLLGGITGGLVAPAFYPRPIYPPYQPYPLPPQYTSYQSYSYPTYYF